MDNNNQSQEDQKKSSQGSEEMEVTEEKASSSSKIKSSNVENKNENNNENNNAEIKPEDGKNKEEEETNNYDYEQNKRDILEKIEIRKQQADLVEKYIYETGIGTSFQIIFSELISKKIPVENYYQYTASRLRQIGREKENLDRKKK